MQWTDWANLATDEDAKRSLLDYSTRKRCEGAASLNNKCSDEIEHVGGASGAQPLKGASRFKVVE